MIDVENTFAAARGSIQGFKRGFYNQKSLEIRPECFGSESDEMGFQVYSIFKDFDWARIYELPGYFYQIYLSADNECQL